MKKTYYTDVMRPFLVDTKRRLLRAIRGTQRYLFAAPSLLLARYHLAIGEIDRALQDYHKAFRHKPDLHLDVYAALGERVRGGKTGRAQRHIAPEPQRRGLESCRAGSGESFSRFPISGTMDFSVLHDLGVERERDGRFTEAAEAFSTAIAVSGNYRETRDLDKLLAPLLVDDTVIITQLANNYFPLFEIWYRYFSRHGLKNLLVIALDPVLYKRVRDMGITAYLLPIFNYQEGIRETLWYETLLVRQKINQLGVHYLHTDIDAIWLKNPMESLDALSGDIRSSIAYATPPDALQAWGFVLCFGFYSIRSNEATRAIYPRYVRYTRNNAHDQDGMNRLLLHHGMQWRERESGFRRGECARLRLRIDVLPETMISRKPASMENGERPFVFHPSLRGGMADKIAQLKSSGIG